MLTWMQRRAPAHSLTPTNAKASRTPSDLLAFVAGEFAGDIARLWPAPHSPFLLAEAARRHLACLALSVDPASAVREALQGPFKRALRSLAPGAPAGLARALGRMGEQAWSARDYGLLLGRLADPNAAKVLHHAPAISPREVRVLAALPGEVVAAGRRFVITEEQSLLLAECYRGIARRDGPEAAAQAARRWAATTTPSALFRRVASDVTPQASAPPHPGTARLRPLATKRELVAAGRRYRNCLADRVLDGYCHYYEWLGPPGAIVSVSEDYLFGWRLDEAMAAGNALLSPQAREEIEAELRKMGVHLGRSAWNLKGLVDDEAYKAELAGREAV